MLVNPMKALSWKSPYGELMLRDKIETRTWSTNYRGLVLICLTKKPCHMGEIIDHSGYDITCDMMDNHMSHLKNYFNLQGHAIAVGRLVDCRVMAKYDEVKSFVKYKPGLYCHVYRSVRPIEPFPFKGAQRWTNLSEELIQSVKYLNAGANL